MKLCFRFNYYQYLSTFFDLNVLKTCNYTTLTLVLYFVTHVKQ